MGSNDVEVGIRPFVTGDVIADPAGEKPFSVVFKQGVLVLSKWQVDSIEEGEQQILKILMTIGPKE